MNLTNGVIGQLFGLGQHGQQLGEGGGTQTGKNSAQGFMQLLFASGSAGATQHGKNIAETALSSIPPLIAQSDNATSAAPIFAALAPNPTAHNPTTPNPTTPLSSILMTTQQPPTSAVPTQPNGIAQTLASVAPVISDLQAAAESYASDATPNATAKIAAPSTQQKQPTSIFAALGQKTDAAPNALPSPSSFQNVAQFIARKFTENAAGIAPVTLPSGEDLSPEGVLNALAHQFVTGDATSADAPLADAPPSADPAMNALRSVWTHFIDNLPKSPVGAVSLPDTKNVANALHADAHGLAPLSKSLDAAIDSALKLIAKNPDATQTLSPELQEQIAVHISHKSEFSVTIEGGGETDQSPTQQLGNILQKFRLLYDLMASGALEEDGVIVATLQHSAQRTVRFSHMTATDISVRAGYDGGPGALAAALQESDAEGEQKERSPAYMQQGNAAQPDGQPQQTATTGNSAFLRQPQKDLGGDSDDNAPSFNFSVEAKDGESPEIPREKPSAAPVFNHWSAMSWRPGTPTGGGEGAAASVSYTDLGRAAERTQDVLAQVKVALQGHNGGNLTGNIRLQLQPAELGVVNIRMQKNADGKHRIHISAERPETLALMQQQESSLRGMLQEIISSDSSTDFSFRFFHEDGSSQGERRESEHAGDEGENSGNEANEQSPQTVDGDYVIDGLVNIRA